MLYCTIPHGRAQRNTARILVITVSFDCGRGHESIVGGGDTSSDGTSDNSNSRKHGNSGNIIIKAQLTNI